MSLPDKKSEERSRPREMTRAWIRRRSLRVDDDDDESAFEMEADDGTIELICLRVILLLLSSFRLKFKFLNFSFFCYD